MSTHQIKLKQLRRLKFRNIFLNTVCILLALAGISWTVNYFWKYARYEITNDAVVDQYIAPLNIRIPGYIKEVRFTEHQYVHAGDTLLILDDREYRIRLKDAEAALMDALGSKEVLNSGIRTSGVNVAVQEANIAETLARLSQQEAELNRYTRLLKKQAVSQQDYELAKANPGKIQRPVATKRSGPIAVFRNQQTQYRRRSQYPPEGGRPGDGQTKPVVYRCHRTL